MRFPRNLLPVLGWCAATLASIALASVAMLPVLRTAAPDDGALVSADQLRDARDTGPIPLPSLPSAPAGASASPSRSPAAPHVTAASPARSSPSPARTSPSPSPSPVRTTTQESTVEDGWTVTRDDDGEKSYVRSFRVAGGQTVIRMTPRRVTLVTATPADGYEVATVQNSPDNLAVYFNEVGHSFVIHALWHDNRPFAQVSEVGK